MTKERILLVFKDINQMYNNARMYDSLSKMLDELVEESKKSVEPKKCGDCISRKAATDRFDLVQSDDKCMGYDDILAFLSSLPSVEPEGKKGKWITKDGVYGVTYCSECDYEMRLNDTNYCPNCGADMREVENCGRGEYEA